MAKQAVPLKTAGSPVPISSRVRDQIRNHMQAVVVGQADVVDEILPYVELYEAGLAPDGRPVGVFMLLGPTGTGKTHTVEALAEAIHGTRRCLLRVDCGEFQLEHEVAKLIGAPPGYLGHRETQPMISQHRLNASTSERSNLSIVLFDEIEKAAPSMGRLLLGVLDKATLKLGDNTSVNFERSLIFMTSNLGAREMESELTRGWGLASAVSRPHDAKKIERLGMVGLRKRFSPEFINRVDRTLVYRPLGRVDYAQILALELDALQRHLVARMGPAAFQLSYTQEARDFLLDRGVDAKYGARELKRMIHKYVLRQLAAGLLDHTFENAGRLRAYVNQDGDGLEFVHVKSQG